MHGLAKFLAFMAVIGALVVCMVIPDAIGDPPPVIITPGKDSQVFRPETPGYLIKKNRDQVGEFMQVPPPSPESGEQEKKKDDKSKEQEGNPK